MKTTEIDGLAISYHHDIGPEELGNYVKRGREKYGDALRGMTIHLDGDYAEITYNVKSVKFDRIRRITGYLVGTLDRFNDAKLAEVNDRVKHGVGRQSNGK